MNQRIRELARQAGLSHMPSNYPDMADLYKGADFELEKFAELIVRECIEQASISNGHGNNQWDKALTFAADNIKKHFGVEE